MSKYFCPLLIAAFLLINCSKSEEPDPSPQTADLKVTITTSENKPVPNATLSTDPESKSVKTDMMGVAVLKDIKPKKYILKITIPDDPVRYEREVFVELGKENSISFETLAIVDPISEAPLDYEGLIKNIYSDLKGYAIFDATGYIQYWGDTGADICMVNREERASYKFDAADSYNLSSSDQLVSDVWTAHYQLIYLTNYGLDRLEETSQNDPNLNVKTTGGELRFLRALAYFNLVKIYGNPLLVTTTATDVNGNTTYPQGGAIVYDQIIEDLLFAIENLNPIQQADRASLEAAQALLGKVYLQSAGFPLERKENYAKALNIFGKLEGKFTLPPDYASIFDPEDTSGEEVIFKVDFSSSDPGGNYGVYWGPKGRALFDNLLLTPSFSKKYFTDPQIVDSPVSFPLEIADSRFDQNIATFTIENNKQVNTPKISDWRPYKYIKNSSEPINRDQETFDLPILRYADVLLMIAEAENALNGPSQKAYNAINQVRRRAYKDSDHDLKKNLNAAEFLSRILEERKKEFALEGLRKDDLIRTGQLEATINNFNAENPDRPKNYEPFKTVWPIPQLEVIIDPTIEQNDGY